jgi:hypothetical protein
VWGLKARVGGWLVDDGDDEGGGGGVKLSLSHN